MKVVEKYTSQISGNHCWSSRKDENIGEEKQWKKWNSKKSSIFVVTM
jgi:hypothetical protein